MSYFTAIIWPVMKGRALTWHLWSDKCWYGMSRVSTWVKKILRLVKTIPKQGLCQVSGSTHRASCRILPALAVWMNTHSKPSPWSPFGEDSKEESTSRHAACCTVTPSHDTSCLMGTSSKVRRNQAGVDQFWTLLSSVSKILHNFQMYKLFSLLQT